MTALVMAGPRAEAGEKAAAMVIDANTGLVLHDNAGNELRHPASLTKMMTLYLAFEAVEAGRLSFTSPLTVSERAAAAAPSKLGLEAGSTIAMRDAIKALVVKSANDVAVTVAERIGGSEQAFAALMTKRARQLGMHRTVFRNASGLPDPAQVTTARDMLTLAMRLQDDFPQHYRLFALRTFSYGGKTYRTHNGLLGRFQGVDGVKTGYTRASGFNLVSSYQAGGKHVVAAVFGGVSAGLRDAHMRMLLARSIEKASTTRTRKAAPQLVAEARPARRPAEKPVARAEPDKAKPAPTAAPGPIPSPARPIIEPAIEAGITTAVAEPAPARIAIAKVKTVPVLPQTADGAPAVEAAPETTPPDPVARLLAATALESAAVPEPHAAPEPAVVAAGMMPRPAFAALKAELAAREAETPTAAETSRSAEPVPLAAPSPQPSATASDEAVFVSLDSAARPGRLPSTLQAQLAGFTTEPSHLGATPASDQPALFTAVRDTAAAPDPAAPAAAAAAPGAPAGFQVQIGVYSSPAEAERAMAAARAKAAHVLGDSAPVAMPLTKGDRQLYRARFAGFDSAAATTACNELRRLALDCFVARSN